MLECLVKMKYPDAEPCNWKRGERKKRLFLCASLSRIGNQLPVEYRKAFEILDPEVEVQVSDQIRRAIWSAAENVRCADADLLGLLFAVGYDDIGLLCFLAARIASGAAAESSGNDACRQKEQEAQAALLRGVFGNPFRPVTLDPAGLTPKAKTLAQAIYDDRAFDRMPELAAALAEAGCTIPDILSHCRGPRPHVRGCWVVDLVLGTE